MFERPRESSTLRSVVRLSSLGTRWRKQLDLDVVRITKDQNRAEEMVLDRGLRARLVSDWCSVDPLRIQVGLPDFQIRAAGNSQSDVIETSPRLGEELALVGVVAVQGEDQLHVLVGQDLARAARVRHLHAERDPEDALVPGD